MQVVVFTGAEEITGVSAEQADLYTSVFSRPPTGMSLRLNRYVLILNVFALVYRAWAVNVSYAVLLWIGFVFTCLSLGYYLLCHMLTNIGPAERL